MKAVLGSIVFLVSLFVMRQILVGAGLMSPLLAVLFLVAAVGIPLGGIVFLEGAFERENRELREEIRELRDEVAALKRARESRAEMGGAPPSDVRERSVVPRE